MDNYLVYGNPIAQSKSPTIHQWFAEQTKQNLHYDKKQSTPDTFVADIQSFIAQGGKGANVTAPFKEQAMLMCDELSDRAQAAGAVNTLHFENGKIYGDNTDGVGLVNDLKDHDVTLTNKTILLMGAGGASRGVILPLLEQQPKSIIIVNRTLSKAQALVERFSDPKLSAISFEITQTIHADIIINATSASLSSKLPNLAESIVKGSTCYDMVYGKQLTPFLLWCQQHNADQVIDGLGMLVGQAAESFYKWRKVKPNADKVLKDLRKAL